MDINNEQNGSYVQDYYDRYMGEQIFKAKKTFSRAWLSLVIYTLVANVAVIIWRFILTSTIGANSTESLFSDNIAFLYLVNFVSQYILALPALFLVLLPMKPMTFEKEKISVKEFLMFFLVSQTFMQAGALVGQFINSAIGSFLGTEIENGLSTTISLSSIWQVLIFVVIIGPIFEEIIFRKLLFDRLTRYGTKIAIISTSVAFGFFHGNLYQLFYAILLGLVLGYLYAKTRNILYSILLHVMINLFGTLPALLLSDTLDSINSLLDKLENNAEISISRYLPDLLIYGAYSLISNAIVIAGLVIFILALRNKKIYASEKCEFKLPKEQSYATVLVNFGGLVLLALSVLMIFIELLPS